MKLLVYQIDNMTQKVMVNKNEMLSCPEMNMYTYGTRGGLYIKRERIDQLINGTWTIDYMEKKIIPTSKHTCTHTFCLG